MLPARSCHKAWQFIYVPPWSPAPTLHVQLCLHSLCSHFLSYMFWVCVLYKYHCTTTLAVFGPNRNTTTLKMVLNERCERCWNHKPRARRMCGLCLRRVGPGCWPEHCLMIDAYDGEGHPSICRDCWPAYGPAPLSRDFYEIWKLVQQSGF